MNTQQNPTDDEILEAFRPFEHFSKAMLDAYIIINNNGRILKANPLFSSMLGMRSRQILKANSLDELIKFSVDGQSLPALELVHTAYPTRMDEVRGDTSIHEGMNLILGIYPFLDKGKVIGIFLLIRDVTAETNLQDKYKVKATQSVTDKLTGLYNRAYFEQYLPEMLSKLDQKGRKKDISISVVMADIDHFKKINDTHGHQAGDHVLETVSAIFKNNFRKTDVTCRYGGEEFLTILPSTDANEAFTAAEKLRRAVAAEVFTFNKAVIPVTISMGIAQIAVGVEKGSDAIARADAALYFAKENGRNRVCTNREGEIS